MAGRQPGVSAMRISTHAGAHPVPRPRARALLGRRLLLGGGLASLAVAGALAAPGDLLGAVLPAPVAAAPPPLPPPTLPRLVGFAPSPAARRAWAEFRQRFIAADGRVIDTGNGNVTHTEGQGWGLLLAAAFADEDAFTRIADFTRTRLRRGGDALHAWCWRGGAEPVPDWNNATDGDLYIAAGLARGAALWGREDWAREAGQVARDVLRLCTREIAGRLVLLPGAYGFDETGAVIVNPSYYAFGLFPDLAAVAPSADWARLRRDGLALIEAGRFGRWRLPPDWLRVGANGFLSPAPGRPPRFSYDAIRIPLHLVWGNVGADLLAGPLAAMCADAPGCPPPAWVDLTSDARASYAASPGMAQVISLVCGCALQHDITASLDRMSDYYSSGLIMLCLLALNETDSRS